MNTLNNVAMFLVVFLLAGLAIFVLVGFAALIFQAPLLALVLAIAVYLGRRLAEKAVFGDPT